MQVPAAADAEPPPENRGPDLKVWRGGGPIFSPGERVSENSSQNKSLDVDFGPQCLCISALNRRQMKQCDAHPHSAVVEVAVADASWRRRLKPAETSIHLCEHV